ncbi:hypothetical protein SAMN05216509_3607 [Pseudomonas sp. B10]|jgi:hypothetical protein|uniref:Uncharacterized protein n=1 Tax=Pseudomonas atacamensis TaxID=2565368 RepID=A0AAQ2I273_9PSED|nr:hypothetical protein E5170_07115 [Pseudomonas atacamensis]SIR64002.1 hypothetical protein SAMN05216509_3607 [Pseudomonas sp. B10]
MPGNILRKGTLLILSGPANHLHIVMNNPVYSHEHGYDGVLAVNISSIKPGIYHDPSCILTTECHPYVRWDSWVVYKEAAVFDASRLDLKVDAGEIVAHHPVSDDLYERIRSGFDVSIHLPRKIGRFIRHNHL